MVNYSLSTWQKQLMASDHNLIDFNDDSSGIEHKNQKATSGAAPTMSDGSVAPNVLNADDSKDNLNASNGSLNNASKQANKPNKSLFEITRVETSNHHGDSVGGEDSEMDDSVSSSTSILDVISKDLAESEKKDLSTISKTKLMPISDDNENITANDQQQQQQTTSVTTSSSTTISQQAYTTHSQLQHQNSVVTTSSSSTTTTEPQSRFRIVKIAKQKPYERGTWMVSDFNDSQKQPETSETAPSSPAVKRNRNPASESGVTSPTEPIKTKSSEFLAQNFSSVQSRGSSYNTNGDRRSSVER